MLMMGDDSNNLEQYRLVDGPHIPAGTHHLPITHTCTVGKCKLEGRRGGEPAHAYSVTHLMRPCLMNSFLTSIIK